VNAPTPDQPTEDPTLLHYTEYDTRLASYAVITHRADDGPTATTEVLLALWNEPERKRWTLPGGGTELHESPEEGCVREVREETGYDVVLTGLLGIETDVIPASGRFSSTDRPARPLKAVRVFYTARIVGGELSREENGTTDEARWHPLAEVPELPHVSMVDTGLDLARQAGILGR
jgi:8-oxo-dGTP diphosphatase